MPVEASGPERSPAPLARPWSVALAGLLSLAIAMGIGRFAFTPLLPMMLHDGAVDLAQASALATANYLGYWLGAMACTLQPALWRRLGIGRPVVHTGVVRAGLVATVVLTLAMAWPLAVAWPAWRLLAGVASAVVFVYVSAWCLARLAVMGAPALAGVIYMGPGLGITVSGLAGMAMVSQALHSRTAWALCAVLAAGLTAWVWPQLRGTVPTPAPAPQGHAAPGRSGVSLFALAYGLAGFGYIITATYLPVIARQSLSSDGTAAIWLDLFWPLFGIGVTVGAALTLRLPVQLDRRHLLSVCYAMQAVGVVLSLAWPTRTGFALGSVLLGLPFTAITLFAMQEARRLWPHDASALIGLVTAAYGLGQIAGPPMTAWMLARSASPAAGFAWALQTAAAALVLGAVIYQLLARRQPRAA